MAQVIYHSSIEGAQHGPKGLDNFLAFAKQSGASGAQPSNYMIEADGSDGAKFKSGKEIKDAFECINDGADQGLSNGTAGEDVRADAVA